MAEKRRGESLPPRSFCAKSWSFFITRDIHGAGALLLKQSNECACQQVPYRKIWPDSCEMPGERGRGRGRGRGGLRFATLSALQ